MTRIKKFLFDEFIIHYKKCLYLSFVQIYNLGIKVENSKIGVGMDWIFSDPIHIYFRSK